MSGIIGSKLNIRGSNRVSTSGTDGQVLISSGAGVAANYEDAAAGISWQAVETGSTMTAVAGEGYWVDTSSNACTITLPASASVGDTIIFADYARNWGTNSITIDSNGLNYQGEDDTFDVEYDTDGTALRIVYMDATKGWIPTIDKSVSDVPSKGNQNGIFAYGIPGPVATSNTVSNVGVVSADVSGVGTARSANSGCEYGGDKGIFAYGSGYTAVSNLVSNTGVVGADVTGVGTARDSLNSCSYGGDKGIFCFGYSSGGLGNITNLVSNAGVVATDVSGVGTARQHMGACEYSAGQAKAILAFGDDGSLTAVSNLISNVGVVAADVTGVGTARSGLGSMHYDDDKGLMAFGNVSGAVTNLSNKISNVGVVASDTAGVGTARRYLAGTQYGGDKGIVAYGSSSTGSGTDVNTSNLVSNTGVVATDTTGVGTARNSLAACSYN
jgi:hypothetical protein